MSHKTIITGVYKKKPYQAPTYWLSKAPMKLAVPKANELRTALIKANLGFLV